MSATPPWRAPVRRRFPLAVYFLLHGFVPAHWMIRIPDLKDQVGASGTTLGIVLLVGTIGYLAMTPVAARLTVRYGTRPMILLGGGLLCLAVVPPALATTPWLLGATLVAIGATQAVFQVAVNSAGVEVEAALGRSVMPTLHGLYSLGALGGAVVGGFVSGLAPLPHFALMAVLGLVTVAAFGPMLARSPGSTAVVRPKVEGWRRTPHLVVILLFGVVGLCTAWGEFAANNWTTLHVREELGASASVAAYVFAAYSCAITAGRFVGSRVIRLVGTTPVLTGGFLLAAVGMLLAAWSSRLGGGLPLAIAGYVALGLGLANAFPIAIARAGAIGGPTGISRVTVFTAGGILGQAPVIGFLADNLGLPAALSTVSLFALLAAGVALALHRHSTYAPAPVAANASRTSG
ncbi:MFS transporter [Tenggerimyces flavus]|uniref:MFS transporter n=1 Tax=Tenggerimyces flavus TaxID=1708749 RepID=A0ABV7YPF7_9ACTN|nr:MFS transporter [Tenggerimyces flavus]MBM7787687.1 MFS family permease [Tenggerimyces flavus]